MKAFDQIINCINDGKSFVLEAGAGSGKTYTLIQTLDYLIANKSNELLRKRQKIICITYTNVAKNEIIRRLENNPLVLVLTIHEFLWSIIQTYQKQLKQELCILNEYRCTIDKTNKYSPDLQSRIVNIDTIFYNDAGFRNFEEGQLHHDDVIELSAAMFKKYSVFKAIVAQTYPFIFIDEYQDTDQEIVEGLLENVLADKRQKIILGFYGDSYQKIYDSGVGDLEKYFVEGNKILELIKKEENYRSSKSVVNLLNQFRRNITQKPQNREIGIVQFLYWEAHPDKLHKEKVIDFENRVSSKKNELYDKVLETLRLKGGWDDSIDKILVLANRRVAERAGFGKLYEIFYDRYNLSTKERLLDRENPLIRFFTGYIDKKNSVEKMIGVEHLMDFWMNNDYNEVIRFIRKYGGLLDGNFKHDMKRKLSLALQDLYSLRNINNIKVKEIFEFITNSKIISGTLIDDFNSKILSKLNFADDEIVKKGKKDSILFESFMDLPYKELLNFWHHIQNNSVFSTKHGTKGSEFRNVFAVIDDTEWKSKYNFNEFFCNPSGVDERIIRTRNLFYVECSRAKENLVVLALSKIDKVAIDNLNNWFGTSNVISIEKYIDSDLIFN